MNIKDIKTYDDFYTWYHYENNGSPLAEDVWELILNSNKIDEDDKELMRHIFKQKADLKDESCDLCGENLRDGIHYTINEIQGVK